MSLERIDNYMFVSPNLIELIANTGIYLGAPPVSKDMSSFVTPVKGSEMCHFKGDELLRRINIVGNTIAKTPEKMLVYSKFVYARTPIARFSELTGVKSLTGRFHPGTFTNPSLKNHFIDASMILIVQPPRQDDENNLIGDTQAIIEAANIGIPVFALNNSNDITTNIDIVIPCNNRGRRSLATVFWLLSRAVLYHQRKLRPSDSLRYSIDDFETKIGLKEDTLEVI